MKLIILLAISVNIVLACPTNTLNISSIQKEKFVQTAYGSSSTAESLVVTANVDGKEDFKLYLDDDKAHAMLATIALNPGYGVGKDLPKEIVDRQEKMGHKKNTDKLKYLTELAGRLCSDEAFQTEAAVQSADECKKKYSYPKLSEMEDMDRKMADLMGGYVGKNTSNYGWPFGAKNSNNPSCLLVNEKVDMGQKFICTLPDKTEFKYDKWVDEEQNLTFCYTGKNVYQGMTRTAAGGSSMARGSGPSPKHNGDCVADEIALKASHADYCLISLNPGEDINFWSSMNGFYQQDNSSSSTNQIDVKID